MGLFSRSSKGKPYRNGHYGSNHYQRKGLFGNLINVFGSKSSHDNYNVYPEQYRNDSNPTMPNQFMDCSQCNTQIPVNSKFCPQCGEKLNGALFCIACGEKLPQNAKFCLKCGTKLNV
jgi:ribosomal protein L40E